MSDQNIPTGTYTIEQIQTALHIYNLISDMVKNDNADLHFRFDQQNLICISWAAPKARA